MPPCIVYHFAYANKRERTPPPALILQRKRTSHYVETAALEVLERVEVVLTNRDKHFAGTAEFVRASARAVALGCPLVVGDLEDLIKRTHPAQMVDCVSAVTSTGAELVDARAGGPPDVAALLDTIPTLAREALARRQLIKIGMMLRTVERHSPANNQARAARGTVLKANRAAAKLAAVVEDIKKSLPAGMKPTPTVIASALNARGVLTDRGNQWSRTAVSRLLERIEKIKHLLPAG